MTGYEAQEVLRRLGELEPPLDGNLKNCTLGIRRFQRATGLSQDGIVGPKTMAKLLLYRRLLEEAPPGAVFRQWRFTRYQIAEQRMAGGVPVQASNGQLLAKLDAQSFADFSLQGTGRLIDGRLLNVAGDYVAVNHDDFAGVLALAERNRWVPKKPGYAGIRVREDSTKPTGWRVTHALAFRVIPPANLGLGYGVIAGIPLEAYKTAASDVGLKPAHDPRFKGQGGVLPRRTRFFILEWLGVKLPDGTIHDGWWTANDTGGGIDGNQCDLFAGFAKSARVGPWPHAHGRGYVTWPGIEERIPAGYEYGS